MIEILRLNSKNYKKALKTVTEAIKQGKVTVCPTDTVYGLICNATNKKAVKTLLKIKKRPTQKPIPIFVKDIRMAKQLAFIDERQEKFLKKVWPGKVTVVLKSRKGKNTIGLRIPRYKFILNLIEDVNVPLTGTSANISGQPSSTKIRDILRQFNAAPFAKGAAQPDLVINDGNLKSSKPSTVIDLSGPKLKILRKGQVGQRQLLKLWQN